MRCLNCQSLGHTKKHCRRPEVTSSQCGEDGHTIARCDVHPPRCVNCGGEHTATDRNCPFNIFKYEVVATQTKEKLTYIEAEDKVKATFRQENKQYSFIVKKKPWQTRDRTGPQTVQPQKSPKTPNNTTAPTPTIEHSVGLETKEAKKTIPRTIDQRKQTKSQRKPPKKPLKKIW